MPIAIALAGRWAGNAVNCARYFPTQACNFAFKDRIKALLPRADRRKEFGKFFTINMISGGLAGAISLCFVYPLDAARTLLALDAHGVYGGSSWNCLTTVVAANGGGLAGLRALYSGFLVAALGIVVPLQQCEATCPTDAAIRSVREYLTDRNYRGPVEPSLPP